MLAPLLALSLAAQAGEHRHALVIGANHGAADEPALRYAEADARRVAGVVQALGRVHPEDLVELRGPDADEVRRVMGELQARLEREAADGERSLLLVYYAGHADGAALHLGGSRLPLSELVDRVEAMPVDVRVLVIDACQAGEALRLRGGSQVPAFDLQLADGLDSEGLALITSAAAGEDAQESDRLEGGVFTHHLVVGLSGAADDSRDGRITLDEVYRYTYSRTLASTSRAPVVQHPSYAFDLQGQADVVLTELTGGVHTSRLHLGLPGSWLVLDEGQTRLVAELEVADQGTLAVAPGSYRLVRRLPDRVFEGTVELAADEVRTVGAGDLDVQPLGQAARRGQTTRTHVALGLLGGGGVAMAPLRDQHGGPVATLGLRAELPWISLLVRGRGTLSGAENALLSQEGRSLGGEVVALRLADLGPASLGLGLAGGASAMWQRFETTGEAPDRLGAYGHGGPVARAELALLPRLSLGLEGVADIDLLKIDTERGAELHPQVVPRGGLDVTLWLR